MPKASTIKLAMNSNTLADYYYDSSHGFQLSLNLDSTPGVLGNEGLRLELKFFHETDAEAWMEKIEELGFTCRDLKIFGEDN